MTFQRPGRFVRPAMLLVALLATAPRVAAQGVDCARLQQLIASGGGGRAGAQIRRQAAEIARTQALIRQNGCEGGFSFFGGGNPQCGGLTQRLQGLQAGMAQLQAGGGGDGGRADLVARFNASCRGGPPAAPPQPRGFLESLFGGGEERREPLPQAPPGPDLREGEDDGGDRVHGGSQAVCVRTCDGGFFPMGISARRGKESLTEMCQALCPGTETAVYTRSPDADIKTAASLEGKPYTELPNAMRFEKHFDASCTCRQAGKSWAETLANAEEVLGATRKGDIVVTKEKSDELFRPKGDGKGDGTGDGRTAPAPAAPSEAATAMPSAGPADGAGPTIRRVGPQP